MALGEQIETAEGDLALLQVKEFAFEEGIGDGRVDVGGHFCVL